MDSVGVQVGSIDRAGRTGDEGFRSIGCRYWRLAFRPQQMCQRDDKDGNQRTDQRALGARDISGEFELQEIVVQDSLFVSEVCQAECANQHEHYGHNPLRRESLSQE